MVVCDSEGKVGGIRVAMGIDAFESDINYCTDISGPVKIKVTRDVSSIVDKPIYCNQKYKRRSPFYLKRLQ